jgi:cytochrome c556
MKTFFSGATFPLFLVIAIFFAIASGAWAGTQLGQSMKQMGIAYKELADDLKQPQEASKDQYLALAATIKDHAKISRELAPRLAQTLPADQRDAMIQAYQKDMDQFMQDVDSLSDALKNSQWDNARKSMVTLQQEMVDGHKQYRARRDNHSQPPPSAQDHPQSEPAPPTQSPSAS